MLAVAGVAAGPVRRNELWSSRVEAVAVLPLTDDVALGWMLRVAFCPNRIVL